MEGADIVRRKHGSLKSFFRTLLWNPTTCLAYAVPPRQRGDGGRGRGSILPCNANRQCPTLGGHQTSKALRGVVATTRMACRYPAHQNATECRGRRYYQ